MNWLFILMIIAIVLAVIMVISVVSVEFFVSYSLTKRYLMNLTLLCMWAEVLMSLVALVSLNFIYSNWLLKIGLAVEVVSVGWAIITTVGNGSSRKQSAVEQRK